jgi:hypothetical protein
VTRAQRLQAHIDAYADRPIVWGECDCSRWVGAWIEAERGEPLPLPPYAGEAEGRALMARTGGLQALWERIALRTGLPVTATPQLGDVGLIATRAGPVGAIVATNGICALRTQASITYLRPRAFLKTWTV